MKTLHLIRHAKSSWSSTGLTDHDRILDASGIAACSLMAEPIQNDGCDFTHCYVSSAIRAQMTIDGITKAIEAQSLNWTTDPTLYTFSATDLRSWLSRLPETHQSVTLVGHNPAFTELINYLSETNLSNLPTCGYAKLQGEVNWDALRPACMKLTTLLTPKIIRESD